MVLPEDGRGARNEQVHGGQRVWAQARIKPHRLDRYRASNDPLFEGRAADIIGLYMNPPQHVAVFCVDERRRFRLWTGPLSPGPAERHGFECYVMAPSRCMRRWMGRLAKCMAAGWHTSQEFIVFRQGLVARTKWTREIHVVLDNLSAHKT